MPFRFDPATGRYTDLAAPIPPTPANPFRLYTSAGPARVPITMDEAVSHLQALETSYTTNDERIAHLEQRLHRDRSRIDRGGFVGKTDREIQAIARAVGADPNVEGWAQSANLFPGTPEWQRFVTEGNLKGIGSARFTGETSNTTLMRQELKALRTANEQIVAASESMLAQASGDATFYRPVTIAEALPFGEINVPTSTNATATTAVNSAANTRQASRRAEAARRARLPFSVGTEHGALVSEKSVRGALDKVLAAESQRMQALTQSLIDGNLSLAQWQAGMMQSVKAVNVLGTAVANGGWAGMDAAEFGWTGHRVRAQYKYLRGFAADIASGRQPLNGSALARTAMYADAGRATHRAAVARLADRYGAEQERNVLGAADHCSGCLAATAQGWVPIGTLVPCGSRNCLSRCHCYLQFRTKPAAKAA